MNTTGIREKLHHFIDRIEDKKAAAIYTLFEENIKEGEESYTDEFKAELDRRYAEYKKDGKVVSREAMDKRISGLR
jgi:putative addiction module component (TIGR02574 family)